jgi:hypothetical protein
MKRLDPMREPSTHLMPSRLPPQLMGDDPYAALDDLMCVIEALCPVWPDKEPYGQMLRMLL